MRLVIHARPARAAAHCAVAARVFLGLVVDLPAARNGAWLSALLGGLLAAPWLLSLRFVKKGARTLDLALMLIAILDAGGVLSALARSAGYLALDRTSPALLLVPAALALIWCVWRNGDAIGYAGMIWARIALAAFLALALMQAHYDRPAWLAPVLGEGWTAIMTGGVRAAGWIVASSAILWASEDGAGARDALGTLVAGVCAAALLTVLCGMLTPTRASAAWIIRLDDLLCNGRAPLYLQLPRIALWFAALAHLLACQCFAAAALLQRRTSMDGRLCGALAVFAALALTRLEALPRVTYALAEYGFVAAAILTALSARLPRLVKEGDRV